LYQDLDDTSRFAVIKAVSLSFEGRAVLFVNNQNTVLSLFTNWNLGYKKHFRVDHGNNEFAQGKTYINGIESFWAFAKTRLSKYKGMNRRTFYLHLKECEFRFNNRGQDLYKLLLKMFRENPLF
jgi:hypothetical protein